MEKKYRRLIATLMSAAIVTATVIVPAAAQTHTTNAPDILSEHISENAHVLLIDPRFDHMSRISSSLSINSLGRANCTGSFTTYDEYDSRMTVVLQQFKNNQWTDIKEWSEDYSGSGARLLEKKYYVPSGYRYRVVTTVAILDSDGSELEIASCDSPIKEF